MEKKEFTTAVLDPKYETFIVQVTSLYSILLKIHLSHRPQISDLIIKEACTKSPNKYVNFVDVFSPNLASKLPAHTAINDYVIKLVDSQQLSYGPIYNLKPVELATLKAYIETSLANRFIRSSKSLADISILFDQKPNGSSIIRRL